jgi:hypothetical protein
MDFNVTTGKDLTKLTTKEMIEKMCAESMCSVSYCDNRTLIVFSGRLRDIPSLKNTGHTSGRGHFLNKTTLAKLKAMDRLFINSLQVPIWRYAEPVSVFISNADRVRSFDTDNTLSTIRDWLEPCTKSSGTKKGFHRGWGVGIVENDASISGGSYHASELGWLPTETRILIAPARQVREELRLYAKAHEIGGF